MKIHLALILLVLALTKTAVAIELFAVETQATKVKSCVMNYVEKGAERSNRSIESFFTEEKKLVLITLNSCLKEQGMAEIETTNENLKAKLTYEKNVMGHALVGFSVEDDKNRYCFPCMYSDNASDWGLQPVTAASSVRKPASIDEHMGSANPEKLGPECFAPAN